jgi:Fe-S-cluster containining protein
MPVKIENSCNGCIECCKFMTVQFPGMAKADFYDFYNKRGCDVKYIDGVTWVVVPFVCPELTESGCRDYPNRPEACKIFDGRKHPIAKGFCKIVPDK